MDTQGRSDFDPADQWVLDPVTGTYQLRLDPEQPSATGPADAGADADADADAAAPSYGMPPAPAPDPAPAVPRTRTSHGGRRAARGGASATPAPGAPGARSGRGRRKAKPRSSHKKVFAWTGGVLGLVVVSVAVGGYLMYDHLDHAITTVDVGDAGSASVIHPGPMNILLIGTDSRQGLGGGGDGDPSTVGHADTTMLIHVSADRTNATAISIPRDLVTGIPDCPTKQKDGSTKVVPGTPKSPNGASSATVDDSLGPQGRDPGCTMRLVAQLTGIKPDHFLMVDFDAVKQLSTAVGGVEVCLKRPLSDPQSHLDLAAGAHRLEGEQAVEFVRTRQALPGGSDLDRIKLQQSFLASMIRAAKADGTLSDPKKLYTLADTAAKALTVDKPIGSVTALRTLAGLLDRVGARNTTFTTLPVVAGPAAGSGRAALVPDPRRAPQLLSLVKRDISLTRTGNTPATPDPRLVGPRTTPHDTRVNVLNGSGTFGAAQDVVNWLQNAKGVNRSDNGGDAPAELAETRLDYAPNQADQARSLAAMMGLPASALHMGTVNAKPLAYMTLTLGKDYTAPGVPIALPTTPPKGLQMTQADSTACVG